MGFVSTSNTTQFFSKKITCSSLKTKLPLQFISTPSPSSHIYHPSVTLKPIHTKLQQKTHASFDFQSPIPDKTLVQRNFLARKGESLVTFGTKNGAGDEDNRALETVLRLYTAFKERNVRKVSDVIADECRCVSNLFSYFHPFYGKKQVLEFLSFLMAYMGKHIEFVIHPTMQDGLNVGVRWKLVWDKTTHIPLGKGFSFYTCHVYHGQMVIRNIEIFMEPLIHLEPLRLKLIGLVAPVLDKIGWNVKEMPTFDEIKSHFKRKRAMYLVLSILIMVLFQLIINFS